MPLTRPKPLREPRFFAQAARLRKIHGELAPYATVAADRKDEPWLDPSATAQRFGAEYSAPAVAFRKILLEKLIFGCVCFRTNLFCEFRIHQHVDFALKFLAPRPVFVLREDHLTRGE